MQSVCWLAHGGAPILNGFWVSCFDGAVVTTAALDGSLCFWSVDALLASDEHDQNKVNGIPLISLMEMDYSATSRHDKHFSAVQEC